MALPSYTILSSVKFPWAICINLLYENDPCEPEHAMASYASGFSAAGHPPPPIEDNDIETEAEDEVDQLDTDSDTEELGGPGSSSKKGGSGPSGERIPGRSLLPATRLENIIQADGTSPNHSAN